MFCPHCDHEVSELNSLEGICPMCEGPLSTTSMWDVIEGADDPAFDEYDDEGLDIFDDEEIDDKKIPYDLANLDELDEIEELDEIDELDEELDDIDDLDDLEDDL